VSHLPLKVREEPRSILLRFHLVWFANESRDVLPPNAQISGLRIFKSALHHGLPIPDNPRARGVGDDRDSPKPDANCYYQQTDESLIAGPAMFTTENSHEEGSDRHVQGFEQQRRSCALVRARRAQMKRRTRFAHSQRAPLHRPASNLLSSKSSTGKLRPAFPSMKARDDGAYYTEIVFGTLNRP
jgi:hypothetical protein